jgi:phosphohistidine phosphatase
MRSLILMRHAKQAGEGPSDHERPLTEAGRRDAQRAGKRLAGEAPLPAYILSSTARRCQETWAAVSVGLTSSLVADFDSMLYNASSAELLQAIAEIDEAVDTLLVLAHNPGISMLALQLASADESSREALQLGFSPATTARFNVEGPWSTLSPRTATLFQFDRA